MLGAPAGRGQPLAACLRPAYGIMTGKSKISLPNGHLNAEDRMKTIALVGCGNWGRNILRDLLRLQCGVHVVDIDPAARLRAKEAGALGAYGSAAQLPDCDGYVVAVPIPDLTPVAFSLLKFMKPVFVEKTLCLSMQDYHLLKGHPGSGGIFVMHKWPYHPGIEALRQLVHAGALGKVRELVTTRYAWVDDFHGGDVFWTQAVHDLTIVKHILGYIPEEIETVHVIRNDAGLPVSVRMILGADPAVFISVSGRHTGKVSGVSIHGEKGTAELQNALDGSILLRTDSRSEHIPIGAEYPLFLELKAFCDYLHGGPPPICALEQAREVTQAIIRLRQSAKLST